MLATFLSTGVGRRALSSLLPCFIIAGAFAADPPTIKQSEFKDLHDRWKDAMTAFGIPGFAVVAVRGDEVILLDAMGVRDAKAKKPVTPDTMFYIASCTKPFNAMTAVALAEDGRLDLDAPVKNYLPQLELSDAALASTITIRDLLDHRWGLDSEPIVFNDAYTGQITDELFFRLLRGARVAQQVEYSNLHYTLLSRVIQKLAGKDWRDVLEERIFQPAGLTRTTGYASRLYSDKDVAVPVIEMAGEWENSPLLKTDRTMHAAGGLGSSAKDLGRWIRLNLGGGQIDGKKVISPEGMAQMLTFQSKLPKPDGKIRVRQGFGLGWGLGTYRGRPYAFHGGGFVGAAAHISFLPENKVGVAVVANMSGGGQALGDIISIDIYDRLLGHKGEDLLPGYKERAAEQRKRSANLPAGENPANGDGLSRPASDYVGRYVNADWGTAEVRLEKQKLNIQIGDLPLALYSEGPDRFLAVVVPDMDHHGRFEVAGGKVTALVLQMDAEEARFERAEK